jgi:hypothetical protein
MDTQKNTPNINTLSRNWIQEYKDEKDRNNKTIEIATKTIFDAIKGIDKVACLPEILANLFKKIESEDNSINNQMVEWANEIYVGRKLKKLIPDIEILYRFCKDEEYTEDNKWEWESGDRTVCYIPDDKKQILLFENQNIQFILVFDDYKIHVREVFKSLVNDNDQYFDSYDGSGYNSVDELRQALKQDNGLEVAIYTMTNRFSRFSNSIEGNEYPDKIDLENMKKYNFSTDCEAFRYGDNRDKGYIFSIKKISSNSKYKILDKCEINDINKADYVFSDMIYATKEIPKKYIKAIKRDTKLTQIGINE